MDSYGNVEDFGFGLTQDMDLLDHNFANKLHVQTGFNNFGFSDGYDFQNTEQDQLADLFNVPGFGATGITDGTIDPRLLDARLQPEEQQQMALPQNMPPGTATWNQYDAAIPNTAPEMSEFDALDFSANPGMATDGTAPLGFQPDNSDYDFFGEMLQQPQLDYSGEDFGDLNLALQQPDLTASLQTTMPTVGALGSQSGSSNHDSAAGTLLPQHSVLTAPPQNVPAATGPFYLQPGAFNQNVGNGTFQAQQQAPVAHLQNAVPLDEDDTLLSSKMARKIRGNARLTIARRQERLWAMERDRLRRDKDSSPIAYRKARHDYKNWNQIMNRELKNQRKRQAMASGSRRRMTTRDNRRKASKTTISSGTPAAWETGTFEHQLASGALPMVME